MRQRRALHSGPAALLLLLFPALLPTTPVTAASRASSSAQHQVLRAGAAAAGGALVGQQLSSLPQQGGSSSGLPLVPVYMGYSLNASVDTFKICQAQSGIKHDLPIERVVAGYGLPTSLLRRKAVSLGELLQLVRGAAEKLAQRRAGGAAAVPGAAATSAHIEPLPMLSGDTDVVGGVATARAASPGGLPRLLHFTLRDKDSIKPHQALALTSWALLNPGYSILLWDDADIDDFMRTYYPQLLPMFQGLETQVERTDLWRYLVLCVFGGVYADSDVIAAKPVDDWAADAGLLVGIENMFPSLQAAIERTYTRQVQMVQWAMAARPGHPVLCRMAQYVVHHLQREAAGEFVDPDHDHAILERTGPGIWSSSVHDYLLEQGGSVEGVVAGGRVGDMRVLPQTVFGCSAGTYNPDDRFPYIYHMFKGTWRQPAPNPVLAFLRRLASLVLGGGGSNDGAEDDGDNSGGVRAGGAHGAGNATRSEAAAVEPAQDSRQQEPGLDAASDSQQTMPGSALADAATPGLIQGLKLSQEVAASTGDSSSSDMQATAGAAAESRMLRGQEPRWAALGVAAAAAAVQRHELHVAAAPLATAHGASGLSALLLLLLLLLGLGVCCAVLWRSRSLGGKLRTAGAAWGSGAVPVSQGSGGGGGSSRAASPLCTPLARGWPSNQQLSGLARLKRGLGSTSTLCKDLTL